MLFPVTITPAARPFHIVGPETVTPFMNRIVGFARVVEIEAEVGLVLLDEFVLEVEVVVVVEVELDDEEVALVETVPYVFLR